MAQEIIVIGAGVAGLACAGQLVKAGVDVLVVDRADKPGGRCATRVVRGAAADYGPLFLHGSDPEFLAAVRESAADPIAGWPARVEGSGKPCQPRAFARGETRLGLPDGVTAFAAFLAGDLPIVLHTQIERVEADGELFTVTDAAGVRRQCRHLVLAVELERAVPLIGQLKPRKGIDEALALLGMFRTVPCLTVIAGYASDTPMPEWDVMYPDTQDSLLMVSNESRKREANVLVVQAAPRWSRLHLEEPREAWADALLADAARVIGGWVSAPAWRHAHRWRHGRLDASNELAAPLVVPLGGSRLGVCGDLFSPGGGVQAAWRSGRDLARRLAAEGGR